MTQDIPFDGKFTPKSPDLTLFLLAEIYAICRLDADAPVPAWALDGDFSSVTRTAEELSIVTSAQSVPEPISCERGWRCLKVAGPLEFSLTGILYSLCEPLAKAQIPLFALSTFDTDYILVKDSDLAAAVVALASAGHRVIASLPMK